MAEVEELYEELPGDYPEDLYEDLPGGFEPYPDANANPSPSHSSGGISPPPLPSGPIPHRYEFMSLVSCGISERLSAEIDWSSVKSWKCDLEI